MFNYIIIENSQKIRKLKTQKFGKIVYQSTPYINTQLRCYIMVWKICGDLKVFINMQIFPKGYKYSLYEDIYDSVNMLIKKNNGC
jgi:hypothetical protein